VNSPSLDSAIAASHDALGRIVNGDPGGYLDLYLDDDEISLGNPFGPFACGQKDVAERLSGAASNYRDGTVVGVELVAKYLSGDFACVVEVENVTARIGEAVELSSVSLRVTSTFRFMHEEWKLVHRHADPITSPRSAASVVQQ
jgi:ketosteroid isomerase-like protein